VEDALHVVGQGFAQLGTSDPRLTSSGSIDFYFQCQLRGYTRANPPPDRVKPIPISVIIHATNAAVIVGTTDHIAVANMLTIAFFFLMRPGEYTSTPSDTTPFTLADVQLFIGHRHLNIFLDSEANLLASTFCLYTFTDQKNGVRGEVIGLGHSGLPLACPILSTVRHILHLHQHHALPSMPLSTYYCTTGSSTRCHPVSPANITLMLCLSISALGPGIGLLPSDITVKSLRAGGAMALLLAHVDTNIIRLISRWCSDEMLRYLHLQAQPIMRNFASLMLHGGDYMLLPGQDVPLLDIPNPQQA
jgi:hypothetical protein